MIDEILQGSQRAGAGGNAGGWGKGLSDASEG